MAVDIIVYGVIAAGLVFWLRNILGTRHGDERERPNPLAGAAQDAPSPHSAHAQNPQMGAAPEQLQKPQSVRIAEIAQNPKGAFRIDNKTAENALVDIARAEKNFDIDFFADAVQDVFVMVVEAFARGDRATLEDLLRKDVFDAFDAAIGVREKAGETLMSEIHAIRGAQVIAAQMDKKMAYITIRFVADETRVLKDEHHNIISGNPDKVSEMIDIWTFAHDLSGRDPRWLLIETRSDDHAHEETNPVPDVTAQ